MSDGPSKRKVLFDEPSGEDSAFAAAMRGEATVGEVLAHMREARGLDLADVANHLRIREPFLAAIEIGDLSPLPGPTYAIGFVRSYANFLGLNGEEAVRLFKGERESDAGQAELVFPEPVAESRIPKGAILFLSVLLAAAAYGGWYYLTSRDMTFSDLVPQVPTNLGGVTTAGSPPPETSATPSPSSVSTPSAAPQKQTTAAAPASSAPPKAASTSEAAPKQAATVEKAAQPAPTVPEKAPTAPAKIPAAPEETAVAPKKVPEKAPEKAAVTAAKVPAKPEKTPVPGAEKPVAATASMPKAPLAETKPAPTVQETTSKPAEAVSSTPEKAPGSPAPAVTAPEKPVATASMPETPVAKPAPAKAATSAPEAVSAPATTAAGSTPTQTASASAQIELRAKADSWVQIRGEGGRVVLMRILRTGDTYKVPNEKGLTLMTGNAGAIEITVNGKPVPSIGPYGAVRRDVVLDAARLEAGTAVAH